ncbi:MAG TPA: site-specific integrase [Polyangiaceae bacterium]|nr:site-specific integrase [Polyangiaceae bacterium]
MADVVGRLRSTGHRQLLPAVLRDIGEADEEGLKTALMIVDGLVGGREQVIAPPLESPLPANPTLKQFGEMWTDGELHGLFPGHVKDLDHSENKPRLERHVYPFIGAVRIRSFSLDHADAVLRQPTLPAGSRRHVALLVHRIAVLATYPGKYLSACPLPKGWLPSPSKGKAKTFVYPAEDAAMMRVTDFPLVLRLLIGFINREGCRPAEAGSVEWTDLDLIHGTINLDVNKTDDARSWVLDTSTAEALRRWKKIAPTSRYVFPPPALPQARREADAPFAVGQLPRQLRELLGKAGVVRTELFVQTERRQRIRAQDLRASFITVSLALGKSETWVADRTGHTSSVMINRYRRKARQVAQLNLGPFLPLHEIVPELAALESDEPRAEAVTAPAQPVQAASNAGQTNGAEGAKVIRVDFRRR